MTAAIVLMDALGASIGEFVAKTTSTTEGQAEASRQIWEGDGVRAGIWEVTPGSFTSTREGFHEYCQILSGRATIEEPDGRTFELSAGDTFITPQGWRGTWHVHEPLRKFWVVQQLGE